MESESCELYLAPGIHGREDSKQRRMVVNLKIMEATNIVVKPHGGKRTTMFVRYHLRAGDDEENNVAVNTREVLATTDPHWKQTFRLKCSGNVCELQKQFVMFELRQRRRFRILGISMSRSSKVVGLVEIPWKDLLASPTLSISSWFPLVCNDTSSIIGRLQVPPRLHLAISLEILLILLIRIHSHLNIRWRCMKRRGFLVYPRLGLATKLHGELDQIRKLWFVRLKVKGMLIWI